MELFVNETDHMKHADIESEESPRPRNSISIENSILPGERLQ